MKASKRAQLLQANRRWLAGLSVVGFIVSAFMIRTHLLDDSTLCNLNSVISCSITRTAWGKLFGVPLSILGSMFFLCLCTFSYKLVDAPDFLRFMQLGAAAGVGFSAYLFAVELFLRTICPLCTIVHVISVLVAVKVRERVALAPPAKSFVRALVDQRVYVVAALLLNVLPFVYYLVPPALGFTEPTRPASQIDAEQLVACAHARGVTLYSMHGCSACDEQREVLGDAVYTRLARVSDWDAIKTRGILTVPAWLQQSQSGLELDRHTGVLSLAELWHWAECEHRRHST